MTGAMKFSRELVEKVHLATPESEANDGDLMLSWRCHTALRALA
jgi:hypothetical protein